MSPNPHPVDEVLPRLREALAAAPAAVLQAPPGAGKTTRVPLALLLEPWLGGGRIVMLEPRRLAARSAARWMAEQLGERVGETVGYRVRADTRVGPRTRVEVVTEGVLTRMLQADPALEGVGLVIFDEYHERNLHTDLGLALCLQARAVLRDDLRLLVMSATLEADAVARLLGGAPVVRSEGRAYPVETRYLTRPLDGPVLPAVARAVRRALQETNGDILVFLPGAGEIRRVAADLGAEPEPGTVVVPLFGSLPYEAQRRAVLPDPAGGRRVVLATSIAETSLTIEGVRAVVDSGLARVPRFSPRTGMTRLATIAASQAATDQRRGRAGRTQPGVCYRLWTEPEQHARVGHAAPEILEADLAPLALELAVWGVRDPGELGWLDPPPAAAYAQAHELLGQLGAVDAAGTATPHGRRMAELALHPRLAHMVLSATGPAGQALACDLAALLGERDVVRGTGAPADPDLRSRVRLLRSGSGRSPHDVDAAALNRVREDARRLRRRLGIAPVRRAEEERDQAAEAAGALVALAFPDRIAQRREGGGNRFLLRNGRGARLHDAGALARAEYLAIAELDGAGRDSTIRLAAPLEPATVEAGFAAQIARTDGIEWDDAAGAVRALRRERLGALILRESQIRDPDPAAVTRALLEGIRARGLAALPWTGESAALRQRLSFLHRQLAGWPDVGDEALLQRLEDWLAPRLAGVRRLDRIAPELPLQALRGLLDWEQLKHLDEWAPQHLEVPSGSRVPIDYADPDAPVLPVRLQEVFGMLETPRIANGRVPLTVQLLSPARRPVQVTRDLASFWESTYFEVRRELKGRYPKHFWPDDPLRATPTRRVRPR